MRICSLLPSTTEILCTLGLEENIVGITHECDYPPGIRNKPRIVMSSIDHSTMNNRQIDKIVSSNRKEGKSTYIVDREKLKDAKPDIIITQGLCDVCAVSGDIVEDAVSTLGYRPEIISLAPSDIEQVLDTIKTLGEVTGQKKRAVRVVEELERRINRVREALSNERDRPRVFCLEWLEPPYVAGHWIPEMINYAGGINGLSETGYPSRKVKWDEILEFAPNKIIVMPCGFNINDTLDELDTVLSSNVWHRLPASRKGEVYLVDANSYFSRPGPRIVEGLEILAGILHPDIFKKTPPVDSVMNLRNYMHLQSFLG